MSLFWFPFDFRRVLNSFDTKVGPSSLKIVNRRLNRANMSHNFAILLNEFIDAVV